MAVFRQASAIGEKRRLYRLDRWIPGPLDASGSQPEPKPLQDAREVWFVGYHSDVGGGYREEESAVAKLPLGWMIREATEAGIRFSPDKVSHLVAGTPSPGQDPTLNNQAALIRSGRSMIHWRSAGCRSKSSQSGRDA